METKKSYPHNCESNEELMFFEAALAQDIQLKTQKKVPYINANGETRNKHVDFYYENKTKQIKVVIECDGIQHNTKIQKSSDKMRDDDIRSRGIAIFRFSTQEIRDNAKACVKRVAKYIEIQKEILKLGAQARVILYKA